MSIPFTVLPVASMIVHGIYACLQSLVLWALNIATSMAYGLTWSDAQVLHQVQHFIWPRSKLQSRKFCCPANSWFLSEMHQLEVHVGLH